MSREPDHTWEQYVAMCKNHSINCPSREEWELARVNSDGGAAQDLAAADAWTDGRQSQRKGHENKDTPLREQNRVMGQADKVGAGTDREHVDVDPNDESFLAKRARKRLKMAAKERR